MIEIGNVFFIKYRYCFWELFKCLKYLCTLKIRDD